MKVQSLPRMLCLASHRKYANFAKLSMCPEAMTVVCLVLKEALGMDELNAIIGSTGDLQQRFDLQLPFEGLNVSFDSLVSGKRGHLRC